MWVVKGIIWLLLFCTTSLPLAAQSNRIQDIVGRLRSSDKETIGRAISDAKRISGEEWTTELIEAVLYSLDAEQWRDAEARRMGYYRWYDENLAIFLLELLFRSQDPVIIPTILHTASYSSRIARVLAAFGRPALPQVITAAHGYDSERAMSCLQALRYMLKEYGIEFFTEEERAELKSIVAAHLSPDEPVLPTSEPSRYGTWRLEYAAIVGLLMEDAEAQAWVRRVATSSDAFLGRVPSGDANSVERTMRTIQGYINGEPFLPPYRPLAEFREAYGWPEK